MSTIEAQTPAAPTYPSDVETVNLADRVVLLVGTAHISAESVELVRHVIENERPQCVCVELDARRYEALSQKTRWEGLDLREVIKNRQLATLLLNFLLSSYQRRLGGQLGVMPGSELLEATRTAEELGIPIELCDRDVRVTLRRAWAVLSLWDKSKLLATVLTAAFEPPQLTEEELRRIRQKDVLSELMRELGQAMPALKRVLIDERDGYLAQKIRNAKGDKIVAVVGAGHVAGMREALTSGSTIDMEDVMRIPPVPLVWKLVGWSIPAAIVASIIFIGLTKGIAAAGHSALFWVLANSIPCAIASALALAHPLTILAAFLAAPFTSLSPLIGAGHVTAFVQAYVHPPRVHEFTTVGDDIAVLSNWWRSRLLRVLLVFVLSSIGGLIGVWIGSAKILSSVF
ncbi:MAG TPA: TraB/GumN family protein [Polyangiales bacterium]